MGRGRAKAKQTRVARDLKYRSYDTDFASLERELRGSSYDEPVGEDEADPAKGSVSHVSPLARALMGKREGDEATVAGQSVEIVAIKEG